MPRALQQHLTNEWADVDFRSQLKTAVQFVTQNGWPRIERNDSIDAVTISQYIRIAIGELLRYIHNKKEE